MNTYYRKKALRERMKKIRAALSDEERAEKSAKILSNLTKLEEYKNAELVLTYVSLKFEVDTFAFIETAHNDGKRIAVPRCVEGKPNIDFYYINSIEELEKGSYGILEPRINPKKLCTSRKGFCVLPGLAFDRYGTRLGYGKGYYDRFLQTFKGTTVGVCFSDVLSRTPLPRGRFDVPAKIIVTEKEIIRIRK
ncbi:hypothetical protein CCDG5_1642 [[Clostridium] cellulosi]|jgi:5,10-methenyltetrahydrofolate synthetase|uniref:5-formyltetrahydrofolate cyclo-ligase n=2 Tax=Bacteria TaxID=2 RepID=A0A078KUA6_9FIRM|nr:hypothetical protein CCDG5_1642 [[Clostridium] cellulosi]